MAIKLEAIVLSIFVLISQNRQVARAEKHDKEIQRRQLQLLADGGGDARIESALDPSRSAPLGAAPARS